MTRKVLIVDDEPGVRALVRMALEPYDVEILEAEDGRTAVDLAMVEHPDLVILDVAMPVMDGVEASRILRKDPETAGCHIVMLTAKARREDELAGLEAGADEYFTKPFSPRALRECAGRLLEC